MTKERYQPEMLLKILGLNKNSPISEVIVQLTNRYLDEYDRRCLLEKEVAALKVLLRSAAKTQKTIRPDQERGNPIRRPNFCF